MMRSTLRRFGWLGLVLAAASLAACAEMKSQVDGIAYMQVGPADPHEFVYDAEANDLLTRNRDVLRLAFTSPVDLAAYARDKGATGNVFLKIGLCPFDPQNLFWIGQVYADGRNVAAPGAAPPAGPPPYRYESFFRYVKLSTYDPRLQQWVDHPVPPGHNDLCFRIDGAGMVGDGFSTNVARIPADDLVRALPKR
jgi:hypothetical protein